MKNYLTIQDFLIVKEWLSDERQLLLDDLFIPVINFLEKKNKYSNNLLKHYESINDTNGIHITKNDLISLEIDQDIQKIIANTIIDRTSSLPHSWKRCYDCNSSITAREMINRSQVMSFFQALRVFTTELQKDSFNTAIRPYNKKILLLESFSDKKQLELRLRVNKHIQISLETTTHKDMHVYDDGWVYASKFK